MKTTPDKWVIISISKDDEDTIYKVFASWIGGYLNGDAWRLNSGIKDIKKIDNNYIISGFSGSEYICHENSYGIIGSHNELVLENIKAEARKKSYIIEIIKEDNLSNIQID